MSTWKNQFVNIVCGQFQNVNLYKVSITYISSLYPFFPDILRFYMKCHGKSPPCLEVVVSVFISSSYLLHYIIFSLLLWLFQTATCFYPFNISITITIQLPLQSRHNKISQSPALKSYRT